MKREMFWSSHVAPTVTEALEVATREAVSAMRETLGHDAHPSTSRTPSRSFPPKRARSQGFSGPWPVHNLPTNTMRKSSLP